LTRRNRTEVRVEDLLFFSSSSIFFSPLLVSSRYYQLPLEKAWAVVQVGDSGEKRPGRGRWRESHEERRRPRVREGVWLGDDDGVLTMEWMRLKTRIEIRVSSPSLP
jgi:hypothetical protein